MRPARPNAVLKRWRDNDDSYLISILHLISAYLFRVAALFMMIMMMIIIFSPDYEGINERKIPKHGSWNGFARRRDWDWDWDWRHYVGYFYEIMAVMAIMTVECYFLPLLCVISMKEVQSHCILV